MSHKAEDILNADYQYALHLQKQFEHEPSTSFTDRQLALLLQQQFEQEASTENPTTLVYESEKINTTGKDSTKSLVDPSWEIVDPTPDIHILFVAFNERFFWNKLLTVSVSWSKRMTSCAGICSYHGRGGMCNITLSEPLLKLRPRKDLVETLLHEMIHAYLFVTHNNKDRDGHGPEFHKHMYRINKEAGTSITVYHSFHDEVRLYQQHWWRCNGPCQNRKPFFGIVKRAINRAPGPNDFWWAEHSKTCGGQFAKVKEPEKNQRSGGKENKSKKSQSTLKNNSIRNYLQNKNEISIISSNCSNMSNVDNSDNIRNLNCKSLNESITTAIDERVAMPAAIMLNSSLEIESSTAINKIRNVSTESLRDSSETSDDYSIVRNHWLKKFNENNNKKRISNETLESEQKKVKSVVLPVMETTKQKQRMVTCPVCNKENEFYKIDAHLDVCLEQLSDKNEHCVVCGKYYTKRDLEQHVCQCLDTVQLNNNNKEQNQSKCPVCFEKISRDCFDLHVEKCLHKMYDDVDKNKDTIFKFLFE